MTAAVQDENFSDALDALAHAADGNNDSCIDLLSRIGDRGPGVLYAACVVWAEAYVRLGLDVAAAGERDNWGLQVTDYTGASIDPEKRSDIQPELWAMRFVVAQANEDTETTLALISAYDVPFLVEATYSLLTMAGAVLRNAETAAR